MNVKPNIDDLRSHHLRPAAMPWQKTRFAGCEFKPLMVDPTSGLATLLFRMAPGAVLPDHEHVLIEQTYVLEGSLVDKEGPDAGTFIAIFQIPNKFYEQDGRVTDPAGKDWSQAWGHLLPD